MTSHILYLNYLVTLQFIAENEWHFVLIRFIIQLPKMPHQCITSILNSSLHLTKGKRDESAHIIFSYFSCTSHYSKYIALQWKHNERRGNQNKITTHATRISFQGCPETIIKSLNSLGNAYFERSERDQRRLCTATGAAGGDMARLWCWGAGKRATFFFFFPVGLKTNFARQHVYRKTEIFLKRKKISGCSCWLNKNK